MGESAVAFDVVKDHFGAQESYSQTNQEENIQIDETFGASSSLITLHSNAL